MFRLFLIKLSMKSRSSRITGRLSLCINGLPDARALYSAGFCCLSLRKAV